MKNSPSQQFRIRITALRDSAAEMRKDDEVIEVEKRIKVKEISQMIFEVQHCFAAVVLKSSVFVELNIPTCERSSVLFHNQNPIKLTHDAFTSQSFLHELDWWQQISRLQKEDHQQSQLITFEPHVSDCHPDSNKVEQLLSFWLDVEEMFHQLWVDNRQAIGESKFTWREGASESRSRLSDSYFTHISIVWECSSSARLELPHQSKQSAHSILDQISFFPSNTEPSLESTSLMIQLRSYRPRLYRYPSRCERFQFLRLLNHKSERRLRTAPRQNLQFRHILLRSQSFLNFLRRFEHTSPIDCKIGWDRRLEKSFLLRFRFSLVSRYKFKLQCLHVERSSLYAKV